MQEIGEAVDHRHGRVLGEIEEILVRVHTRHDPVDVARQDLGRIGRRFAALELDVVRAQVERDAAELRHPHLERHARSCGGLLKDHRQ
jgi:hypothetical protein